MPTTTSPTSHRSPTPSPVYPPPVILTPQQTEVLTRAECYLRLEEHVESHVAAVAKRRTEEEDKLFKGLCAIADLGVNNVLLAQLKTFETAVAPIATDEQQVQRFRTLVRARIDALVNDQGWAVKLALETQLKALTDKQSREQKDVEAVNKQIDDVRARLDLLCKLEEQQTAKESAKAK